MVLDSCIVVEGNQLNRKVRNGVTEYAAFLIRNELNINFSEIKLVDRVWREMNKKIHFWANRSIRKESNARIISRNASFKMQGEIMFYNVSNETISKSSAREFSRNPFSILSGDGFCPPPPLILFWTCLENFRSTIFHSVVRSLPFKNSMS